MITYDYEKIKEWLVEIESQQDTNVLKKSYLFIEGFAQEQPNLRDFIEKGFFIAKELQELQSDTETLATALIYPLSLQLLIPPDIIAKKISESVAKLLMGTKPMETIDQIPIRTSEFSYQQNFIDNLRKMLLAMVDDIRVVLIKLAERLVTLRYCRNEAPAIQKKVAQKVTYLYAPLANRLGIGQLKWQMEDWAFRYLDPFNYSLISKSLNMRRIEREKYIHEFIEQLKNLFANKAIKDFQISGRVKHIYSIYQKIQRKQVNFDEIYDTSAVRILLPTVEDCYTAISIVHDEWKQIPTEFDDYIAKPKNNGYRSIHTAITGPHMNNIEIQIRTYQMHREAELGVAAHWKYKEGKKVLANYEEKINWLREVMHWQKEINHDKWHKIFEDRIYVFTPNGDVIDLPADATPLDFAYHIHTEIGHRCRGAKVNDKMVTLTYPLKTGDRVEILTTRESKPSRDWLTLGYLKTREAQRKVRHWFYKKDREEHAAIMTKVEEHLPKEPLPLPIIKEPVLFLRKSKAHISVEGVNNLLIQIAQCCQPEPQDVIIGYITKNRGISVHHQACFNIKKAIKYRPERIIAVEWDTPTN